MNQDNKRFMLAIVLSAAILFGWQFLFPHPKSAPAETPVVSLQASAAAPTAVAAPTAAPERPQDLQNFLVQNEQSKVLIDNSLNISDYISTSQMNSFVDTVGGDRSLTISKLVDGVYKPLFVNLKTENGTTLAGQSIDGSLTFKAEVMANGKLHFALQSATPQRYRIQFNSSAQKLSNGQVRQFLVYTKDVERFNLGSDDKGDGISKWVGVDFNYHFFGMVFANPTAIRYQATDTGLVTIDVMNPTDSLSGDFVFLKKNYDDLVALGDNLQLTVDFGFFAVIAVPLLHIMQWLYHVIPNYGIAIIVLTLLMRLVLYPLQHKSAKSMKRMQKVQPELKRIQEKFKDDPKRVQKETMELFKRSGANPMGGCLPLILQMPIFFAIYRVLYSAVELVDAPFFGWIQDLSQKDPFYVLPVLMAITMFLQQKVTPTTSMDTNQQKIMMAMPLVFGFIMKDLPSGLVLYIFVSSLFGYVQQVLTYKYSD